MRPASPAALLRPSGLPALLISDPVNVRYLTDLPLDEGYVLVTPRRMTLFVSPLNRLTAARDARKGIAVGDSADLARMLKDIPECGYESDIVSVALLRSWKKKFPQTKFIEHTNALRQFRRAKGPEELRSLRRAHRMTKELLRRVPAMLRRRITEERLARQLLLWALELGADGLAFPAIVAFGTHTACPHHRPTSRMLQKGHLVQIDVGVQYRGYCADMSEVFFTVKPSKVQDQVYRTLCLAKSRATAAVRAGAGTHALDKIARGVLSKAGIEGYFIHSLGHGVGLQIHEGLSISQKAKDVTLLENEVITIEPGVYFPGKFGMRVEDMVYVA